MKLTDMHTTAHHWGNPPPNDTIHGGDTLMKVILRLNFTKSTGGERVVGGSGDDDQKKSSAFLRMMTAKGRKFF